MCPHSRTSDRCPRRHPHRWLDLVRGEKQTLIQMIDDASNRLLYAQLWEGETISKTHLTWGKLINATRC